MTFKKTLRLINIVLFCIMVLHVGVRMYIIEYSPDYYIPSWIAFFNILYYIPVFAIVNIVAHIIKKKNSK